MSRISEIRVVIEEVRMLTAGSATLAMCVAVHCGESLWRRILFGLAASSLRGSGRINRELVLGHSSVARGGSYFHVFEGSSAASR